MRIDHVIYGTADLDLAAARVEAELGLKAAAGGRHDGVGTHNRIVPLGDGSFLELLAVADPQEASGSELGAALQAALARGDGLLGWAVAVGDLGAVAARLGTAISTVGRQGRTARLTAVAESLAEPCLPFFIERAATPRADRPATAISWIEVAGDARRIEHWLGGAELPVRVVEGEPAVRALGIGGRELRTR
jgi:catechol 2,3-dioxygenase-like lactoylglutathione lyase family enzyme